MLFVRGKGSVNAALFYITGCSLVSARRDTERGEVGSPVALRVDGRQRGGLVVVEGADGTGAQAARTGLDVDAPADPSRLEESVAVTAGRARGVSYASRSFHMIGNFGHTEAGCAASIESSPRSSVNVTHSTRSSKARLDSVMTTQTSGRSLNRRLSDSAYWRASAGAKP